MIRFLGSRGATAVMSFFMLALASGQASAQTAAKPATATTALPAAKALDVKAAVREALPVAAKVTYRTTVPAPSAVAPKAAPVTVVAAPVLRTAAMASAAPSHSAAAPAIAREAAWLFRAGWPLYALVDRYGAGAPLDEQTNCLATAVYFEARGESLEGQLAVARVVMNRAASGKYPPSWCATVKQPWQFSFVRNGRFPAVNASSHAWRKAQAIARLAVSNVVPSLASDVLWYHANYVAPSWGRRLTRVEKIGTHIFYRS